MVRTDARGPYRTGSSCTYEREANFPRPIHTDRMVVTRRTHASNVLEDHSEQRRVSYAIPIVGQGTTRPNMLLDDRHDQKGHFRVFWSIAMIGAGAKNMHMSHSGFGVSGLDLRPLITKPHLSRREVVNRSTGHSVPRDVT